MIYSIVQTPPPRDPIRPRRIVLPLGGDPPLVYTADMDPAKFELDMTASYTFEVEWDGRKYSARSCYVSAWDQENGVATLAASVVFVQVERMGKDWEQLR